jgi:hypothetical protein
MTNADKNNKIKNSSDWKARVEFPAGTDFYLFHSVQTSSAVHIAYNAMGTRGSPQDIKQPEQEAVTCL